MQLDVIFNAFDEVWNEIIFLNFIKLIWLLYCVWTKRVSRTIDFRQDVDIIIQFRKKKIFNRTFNFDDLTVKWVYDDRHNFNLRPFWRTSFRPWLDFMQMKATRWDYNIQIWIWIEIWIQSVHAEIVNWHFCVSSNVSAYTTFISIAQSVNVNATNINQITV